MSFGFRCSKKFLSDSSVSARERNQIKKEMKRRELLAAISMMQEMVSSVCNKLMTIFDESEDEEYDEDDEERDHAKGGGSQKKLSRSAK